MSGRILVIEDEPGIVELVKMYLENENYEVLSASDGLAGIEAWRKEKPDLLILDLTLPGMGGLEICRTVRAESDVPMIMLTARAEEADRLVGLELGADDYVTKPFSPRELVARVKAVLRRAGGGERRQTLSVGRLSIDVEGHKVTIAGKEAGLTRTEFELLRVMAEHPGQVFSRAQLMEMVQGYSYEGYERNIDAHIKNLRQKVEKDPRKPGLIKTVFGVGYKLEG